MCGIGGVVRFRAGGPDLAAAAALGGALAHRGPDGEGLVVSGRAVLVHRRLAVIDPTPAGAQPMSWAGGRYQLVWNGEVYNYRSLRAQLEARGERFETRSDTEVLLRLVALDGPASLERVRGMFALALWDASAGSLLVARDRFGIKPLYIAQGAGQLAFASEIGALRRAGLVERTVSAAGVLAYLSWASLPPPLTWLRDVEAVEPGTWKRWSGDGELATGAFADPIAAYNGAPNRWSEGDLRAAVGAAVSDSVRAHLVADVPVGVFLSGGIDSGAIVSAARQAFSGDLHTYTVVVDDDVFSEGAAAARVARRFGTCHHELRVDAAGIRQDLSSIVQRLDQPTADAVNSFYVSRAVAQTGVKAVLSGVGGDELFGGYPSFDRLPAGLRLGQTLGPAMMATRAAAALALPAWRAAKWRHFADAPEIVRGYRALRGFLMPEELPALVGPALADPAVARDASEALADAESALFRSNGPEEPLAAVARLETRGFLGCQLLRDVDVMSMAHGLEVRVPFVDHELQGAVWPALAAFPALARGKRLLHETLADPLPPEITDAPKRGFTLPFESWMRTDLREPTRDGLQALAAAGWISATAPDAVWDAWERGQAHWSRPWGLGILGRFLQEAP